MGGKKSKLNKSVVEHLVRQTGRTPAELNAMYDVFLRNFPTGRIESSRDLWERLKEFSLIPGAYDEKTASRLYRLFEWHKDQTGIDFPSFMVTSNILERGTTQQKIQLYFKSIDVDGDQVITREDLAASLPSTVQAAELIQQLLKQWDMDRDGVVRFHDFERFITSSPNLFPFFGDAHGRIELSNVPNEPNEPATSTYTHPSTQSASSVHNLPSIPNMFVTTK